MTTNDMASVRLPKAFLGSQNHSLPDTKADAVLKHMVGTPGVKSVRYFQGQYVPDSTENIAVAPGINACVQDIQETKDRELQKLTVRLSGAGPHVTARHLTDFVESCDRDFHLDMQNKLGNTTYVFEQVAVSSSAAYRGLPGMPKIKASKSRTALPYVQFTKTPFTTNRTLDNVFFEQRPVLRQRLTFFQQHKVCSSLATHVCRLLGSASADLRHAACRTGTTRRGSPTCWVFCCMGALAQVSDSFNFGVSRCSCRCKCTGSTDRSGIAATRVASVSRARQTSQGSTGQAPDTRQNVHVSQTTRAPSPHRIAFLRGCAAHGRRTRISPS